MGRAEAVRFKRLLAGSTGASRRCKRRWKFCVRIRNGSAFSSRGSIRQTAAFGGRTGKKCSSAYAPSNSSPQSSSSTWSGYYGEVETSEFSGRGKGGKKSFKRREKRVSELQNPGRKDKRVISPGRSLD